MAIESITYKDGFRVKFQWRAGVKGTAIYCVPRGGALLSDAELTQAALDGNFQAVNGFYYGSGATSVAYTPPGTALMASWIDICSCDFGYDCEVLQHTRVGTYFNGTCKIGSKIELFPIAANRRAVRITLQNRSKFAIEANAIGYSVNGRVYGIPVPLDRNERKTLPQFDVGADENVQLCRMEGGYPANFYALDSE